MTNDVLWMLLGVAGILALVAGRRRSKYDGVPVRVWIEDQRMLRTRGEIAARLFRVWVGVAFLVLAAVFAALLIGTLLVAAAAAGLLLAGWWYMRAGARAAAPHVYPAERDGLDLPPLYDEPLLDSPRPAWPDLPPRRGLPAGPAGPADDVDGVDGGDGPVMEV
ncbi:hypothetical protein [Nonomuraea rubra]|uniref:hypothetical protein n=1 Tax=Nonomuraea rubra TaxID=46180 RepID=UPI00340B9242